MRVWQFRAVFNRDHFWVAVTSVSKWTLVHNISYRNEMRFCCTFTVLQIKTHFHMKGCRSKLVLKQTGKATRKRLIVVSTRNWLKVAQNSFQHIPRLRFWCVTLNFQKFKVALNPMYGIYLKFAKSYILSCLSKFCNKKIFHRAVFEI